MPPATTVPPELSTLPPDDDTETDTSPLPPIRPPCVLSSDWDALTLVACVPAFLIAPPALAMEPADTVSAPLAATVPPALFRPPWSVMPTLCAPTKPPALLSSDATLSVACDCAESLPPWFDTAPAWTSSAPFVAIVPPLLDRLPVVTDSVPVPESVMVPWSLISVAGARVRSALFVRIAPPVLSSVPDTPIAIGPVPVCVMVPPRLTSVAAASASWLPVRVPALLSSVAAETLARWPAAIVPPALVSVVPAETVVLPLEASVPALARVWAVLTPRFCTALMVPVLFNWPACTATLPLPPIVPPWALVNRPVVVRFRPSVLSDARWPAVLSRLPALALSAPAACKVPPWLESAPATLADRAFCETIWPPWLDRLPALTVAAPWLERWPRSLINAPWALALNAPPVLVVAPVRSSLPAWAFRFRLPFAEVWLPARLMLAPCRVALPPATFWPVADSAPPATTERSPACASEPSLLTPAPSVPLEATLFALTRRFCCAASVPLFVRSPDVPRAADCRP